MRPAFLRAAPELGLLFGVEEQEPAAARANQLAPDGAVRESEIVPAVDIRVAHRARALLLVQPVLVHDLAVCGQVSGLDRLAGAVAQLAHAVEIVDHLLVVALAPIILLLEHRRRRSIVAGRHHDQVVLEEIDRFFAHVQRLCVDGPVGPKLECRDAAVRGDVTDPVFRSAPSTGPARCDRPSRPDRAGE